LIQEREVKAKQQQLISGVYNLSKETAVNITFLSHDEYSSNVELAN